MVHYLFESTTGDEPGSVGLRPDLISGFSEARSDKSLTHRLMVLVHHLREMIRSREPDLGRLVGCWLGRLRDLRFEKRLGFRHTKLLTSMS